MAETPELFNEIAHHYDLWSALLSAAGIRAWHQAAVERLALGPGLSVLDVGCGTGSVTRRMAAAVGPEGQVTGLDPSAGMLDLARQEPLPPGAAAVRWVEGYGEALPFADATFDRVTAQFSLRNMRDWRQGVAEMARVLKPGGLMVVLDLVQPTTTLGALAMRALEGVTRPLSVPELEPYRWLGRSLLHAATGAELTAALGAAAGGEVGTHHWLGDLVLLATAVRRAVPRPAAGREGRPRAVWATDGSLTAMRAGIWIRDHLAPGTEVHVVTVCPPPPDDQMVAATDRVAWLRHRDYSLNLLPRDRFTLVPVLLDGRPGPRLVEYARRVGAEVLVVGRKPRSLGARGLLGDVSGFVLHHASCPVLAVDGP